MLKKGNGVFRLLLCFLSALIPVILRVKASAFKGGLKTDYAFFAVMIVFAAVNSYFPLRFKNSVSFIKNGLQPRTGAAAYAAAVGFFVSFVQSCLSLYYLISGGKYFTAVSVIVKTVIAVCALLSAIYFITVGMTLTTKRYDFRLFRLFHIVPVIWSAGGLLEIAENSGVSALYDVNGVLKFFVLAFSLGFFYFFARGINAEKVNRVTLLFAGELRFTAFVLFADSAITAAVNGFSEIGAELLSCVTALTISFFCFAFECSIYIGNNTEN